MNREAIKNLLIAWGSPSSDLMIEAMAENLKRNGFQHVGVETSGTHEPAPFVFPNITRVTVIGNDGIEYERYDLYRPGQGAEVHQQDAGRTLKIFPRLY